MKKAVWIILFISFLVGGVFLLEGFENKKHFIRLLSGEEIIAACEEEEDGKAQKNPPPPEDVVKDEPLKDESTTGRENSAILFDESSLEPAASSPSGAEIIEREFTWNYGGKQWVYRLQVPQQIYHYFASRERLPLVHYGVFSIYITDPRHKEFISALANNFSKAADQEKYSLRQTVELVLAFVQSIEYVTDEISKGLEQYTRYPLETLVELQGDCKDKSVLFASILREMGIGTVLVILPGDPGHMAVGIKGENLPGTYYEYRGARYYYVETTGQGWQIGWIPPEYRDREAIIVPIESQPLLIHEGEFKVTSQGQVDLLVTVRNLGTAVAHDTRVYVALDAGEGKAYAQKWSDPLDIKPDSGGIYTFHLRVPSGIKTRLLIKIISDGYLVNESTSEWFTV